MLLMGCTCIMCMQAKAARMGPEALQKYEEKQKQLQAKKSERRRVVRVG